MMGKMYSTSILNSESIRYYYVQTHWYKILEYKKSLESEVTDKIKKMKKDGWDNSFDA